MMDAAITELPEALETIRKLNVRIDQLTTQLDWLRRQLFGAKSERLVPAAEGTPALPGFELEPKPEPPAPEQVAAHERKPREKFGWGEIPEDLPREAERAGMELVGYDVNERLARRAARFFVKVVKRAKYADKADALRGVVTAPALGGCFDTASGKTKFDVSFVVGVVADKIENHLPLHRQSEIMARARACRSTAPASTICTGPRRSGSKSCTNAWTRCF